MARGVDGGQRDAAQNSAYRIDEIDAAWDEAPASMIVPVRVSRQVSVTPTLSIWDAFPNATEEPTLNLRDEPTLVVRDEPTLTLRSDEPTLTLRDEPTLTLQRDEPTLELRASALAADEPTLVLRDEPTREFLPDYVDEDSIVVLHEHPSRASDLAVPDFRRRPRGQIARLAGVGALAIAVAAAGSHFTARARRPIATSPAPTRVPALVPPPATPLEAKPPAPVVAAEPVVAAPATTNLVTVVIEVVPKRASVFRGRERLGSGLVALNVEPNEKQRLTAVLGGYEKAKFTVDGTRDAVTIHLRRVPQLEAPPAPASDSPRAAPSAPLEGGLAPAAPFATAPPPPSASSLRSLSETDGTGAPAAE